jgi:N-acetylglucosaminyl-diphospho-decaprenol L-rhamnosyltransferase
LGGVTEDRLTIDVVVVLCGCAEFVADGLGSLREATARPLRVWLVDNGPGDGSLEAALEAWPSAEVVRPERNVGFGEGCNLAFARSDAPWVLLLNPDARLEPGAIDKMLGELIEHPELAAVGPLVLREDDGTVDTAGMELVAPGWARDRARGKALGDAPRTGRVELLCGAVLLLRREAVREIGRDERPFWGGLFLYNEDVELCHALGARGWELAYLAEARARHRVGASGGPRSRFSAMAARNRVLTLLVHATVGDLLRPLPVFHWVRRIVIDAPKLWRSAITADDRRDLFELLREVRARRSEVAALRRARAAGAPRAASGG